MTIDFSQRSERTELMDEPTIEARELEETLEDLARVNRFFGGYSPSIRGVADLVGERRRASVLDVGTGSGDTPRRLVRWGRRHQKSFDITGIDLSPETIDYARRRSSSFDEIDFEVCDLFEMPPESSFDVVHAALMLHHLPDEDAVAGLRKMYEMSRLGVVINDLHRHPVAYAGSRMLLPVLSKNRLIRHDGPLSVLRAFRKEELETLAVRAGLPHFRIRWQPMFRWQLVIAREDM